MNFNPNTPIQLRTRICVAYPFANPLTRISTVILCVSITIVGDSQSESIYTCLHRKDKRKQKFVEYWRAIGVNGHHLHSTHNTLWMPDEGAAANWAERETFKLFTQTKPPNHPLKPPMEFYLFYTPTNSRETHAIWTHRPAVRSFISVFYSYI